MARESAGVKISCKSALLHSLSSMLDPKHLKKCQNTSQCTSFCGIFFPLDNDFAKITPLSLCGVCGCKASSHYDPSENETPAAAAATGQVQDSFIDFNLAHLNFDCFYRPLKQPKRCSIQDHPLQPQPFLNHRSVIM